MKTIVIYKSKTGYVKKYAQWIAAKLDSDIYEASKVSIAMLEKYDTIIYGGGLYAGGINGLKMITQNIDCLEDKNIIVYASGASPSRESTTEEIRNKNFDLNLQSKIPFYYLRGGFDFKKLRFFDKILMSLLKLKIMSKKEKTADDKGLLASYDNPADFTKEERVQPLVDYVLQLGK